LNNTNNFTNKYQSKRTIKNTSELNEYLTLEKINKFKKTIYDFLSVSNEIDKKLLEITKNNNEYELIEFDINTLIKGLK
jgi:hypothetical protein